MPPAVPNHYNSLWYPKLPVLLVEFAGIRAKSGRTSIHKENPS